MNEQEKNALCKSVYKNESYTIGQLSKLAGVSTRTLRYYEDQGLLASARDKNGYRRYSSRDAKKLAQIISMRSCGLPLSVIKEIYGGSEVNLYNSLVKHLSHLRQQQDSLQEAIRLTEAAIEATERIETMNEQEAFEQIKAHEIEEFEETYGEEARERYGADAIEASTARLLNMSHEEWDTKTMLEESIKEQLCQAMATRDTSSEEVQELVRMHQKWIRLHWGERYNKEAYLGLAEGYLSDPRFVEYYDKSAGVGATEFLVKAIRENA